MAFNIVVRIMPLYSTAEATECHARQTIIFKTKDVTLNNLNNSYSMKQSEELQQLI